MRPGRIFRTIRLISRLNLHLPQPLSVDESPINTVSEGRKTYSGHSRAHECKDTSHRTSACRIYFERLNLFGDGGQGIRLLIIGLWRIGADSLAIAPARLKRLSNGIHTCWNEDPPGSISLKDASNGFDNSILVRVIHGWVQRKANHFVIGASCVWELLGH